MESTVNISFSAVIAVSSNALSAIFVKVEGIDRLFSALHPRKAPSRISSAAEPASKFTVVMINPISANALVLMTNTSFGMVTEVTDVDALYL